MSLINVSNLTFSSLLFTAYVSAKVSYSAPFNAGHTDLHKSQFTQVSEFTFGYLKPSESRLISIQFFEQTSAHAAQPVHCFF